MLWVTRWPYESDRLMAMPPLAPSTLPYKTRTDLSNILSSGRFPVGLCQTVPIKDVTSQKKEEKKSKKREREDWNLGRQKRQRRATSISISQSSVWRITTTSTAAAPHSYYAPQNAITRDRLTASFPYLIDLELSTFSLFLHFFFFDLFDFTSPPI